MLLYNFFFSSTSYRTRIAMALKGLDYDYHSVNLREGEQSGADFIKLNPGKGVPVLIEEDGTKITQSLAILLYLDEKYPEPQLLPTDLLARTRVLELCSVIATDMHPVNNLRILKYLQNDLGLSEEQKNTWYAHWIAEGMSTVEALLADANSDQYCFTDQVTMADVFLIPQVANAMRMSCDLAPYPRAMAIYEHCTGLPAFIKAAPLNQPVVLK